MHARRQAGRAQRVDGGELRIGQLRGAQRARRLLGVVQPVLEQRRAAFDRGRRVVQLVREAGREFAERDHLLVVQAARREDAGAIEHLVDEDRRDLRGTRESSPARSSRGTARISDGLLRDRVARRADQAGVGEHAGDVAGPPLHHLVPAGAAVDENGDAAASARRRGRSTGTPFGLSTSPSARWRSDPCAASHASSSRGAAPSGLCAGEPIDEISCGHLGLHLTVRDPGILPHRLCLPERNATCLRIENRTEGPELVLRL